MPSGPSDLDTDQRVLDADETTGSGRTADLSDGRAAAAAEAAVTALTDTLRQREAGLSPASDHHDDTARLRETLRGYRQFCQNLADVSQQLRLPLAAGR